MASSCFVSHGYSHLRPCCALASCGLQGRCAVRDLLDFLRLFENIGLSASRVRVWGSGTARKNLLKNHFEAQLIRSLTHRRFWCFFLCMLCFHGTLLFRTHRAISKLTNKKPAKTELIFLYGDIDCYFDSFGSHIRGSLSSISIFIIIPHHRLGESIVFCTGDSTFSTHLAIAACIDWQKWRSETSWTCEYSRTYSAHMEWPNSSHRRWVICSAQCWSVMGSISSMPDGFLTFIGLGFCNTWAASKAVISTSPMRCAFCPCWFRGYFPRRLMLGQDKHRRVEWSQYIWRLSVAPVVWNDDGHQDLSAETRTQHR